jgi:hypothetical protein
MCMADYLCASFMDKFEHDKFDQIGILLCIYDAFYSAICWRVGKLFNRSVLWDNQDTTGSSASCGNCGNLIGLGCSSEVECSLRM